MGARFSVTAFVLLAACGGGGGQSGPAPARSSDARLSALVVSAGSLSPAFDPETLSYAVAVDSSTAALTLTPTAAHPGATLLVAGQPVGSVADSAPVALAVGETTVAVDVTAEDGATKRRYAVLVERPAAPDPGPGRLFSPFVDAGLWPVLGALSDEVLDAEGIRHAHLGFIVENAWNALEPAWAGVYAVGSSDPVTGDAPFLAGIARVRAHGGDVAVSFGGAAGLELATAYSRAGRSAADLQQAYQTVIDRYGLTYVDFDIEGFHVADTASVALRSAALHGLQAAAASAGRVLRVSLTLPVMPTGLDANGRAVLQSARSAGVVLDCVNLMCMDYGAGVTDMGQAAIDAAESLVTLLRTMDPTMDRAAACAMVGMTPMIGLNDTAPETFTLADAAAVVAWADANDIRLLSMWSLHRDHPGTGLSTTHSGIPQEDYAFTRSFAPFAPPSPP